MLAVSLIGLVSISECQNLPESSLTELCSPDFCFFVGLFSPPPPPLTGRVAGMLASQMPYIYSVVRICLL